jgi:hypothetical protein
MGSSPSTSFGERQATSIAFLKGAKPDIDNPLLVNLNPKDCTLNKNEGF